MEKERRKEATEKGGSKREEMKQQRRDGERGERKYRVSHET